MRDGREFGPDTDRRSQATDKTGGSVSDDSGSVLSSITPQLGLLRGPNLGRKDGSGLGSTRCNSKPPVGWI
jgi:hypothetical protein